MTTVSPLTLPDPDTARRLYQALEQAGFTTNQPLQRANIAEKDLASYRPQAAPLASALRRTASDSPLDVLTRLFLLGRAVPVELARAVVAPVDLETWVQVGLLAIDGNLTRAQRMLAPVQGLVLASDAQWHQAPGPDHVMHYGGTSHALAMLTIRRPVEQALDLGTGCGVHALLAARHASQVIATDSNQRALDLTAFNARLNGIENVETRRGSLLEPARGLSFGLIVSNPPFVISPEANFEYRDGGLPDDDLARTILQQSAEALQPGGYAQVLCEWVHRQGQPWPERLAEWLARTGCDAWILRAQTSSPEEYAERWIFTEKDQQEEELLARMQRWSAYFGQQGIEAISSGFITLRKRHGRNWLRIDDAPLFAEAGEAIQQGFALRDEQENLSDAVLLEARLRLAPSLRLEQTLAPTPQGWTISQSRIRLSEGLGFTAGTNRLVLALLDSCRGEQTLDEAIAQAEAATGEGLDREKTLFAVRQMIEMGFLVLATA